MLGAIDKQLISRFDAGCVMLLIFLARKKDTNRFEMYGTMQIVESINSILYCAKRIRDTGNVDFVRRFVYILDRYGIRLRLMRVDREFVTTDVMQALNGLNKRFLMPAIRPSGSKRPFQNTTGKTGRSLLTHNEKR